jgi:hypothetical protein
MATSPAGNARAPLTARCGVARCGASRVGFLPKDTSAGFYIWTDTRGTDNLEPTAPASVWTDIKT